MDCPSERADALSRIAATRNPLIFEAAGSLPLEPGMVQQAVDASVRTHVLVHCVYALLSPKPGHTRPSRPQQGGLAPWHSVCGAGSGRRLVVNRERRKFMTPYQKVFTDLACCHCLDSLPSSHITQYTLHNAQYTIHITQYTLHTVEWAGRNLC